jgi:hypothetical protein
VTHLFATFGRNFGDGLWGLLEIVVFGLLGLITLRIACEVLLVFFKVHESAARTVSISRISTSLLDEVKDAINDIADVDESEATVAGSTSTAVDTVPKLGSGAPRRTARRSPADRQPPPTIDQV